MSDLALPNLMFYFSLHAYEALLPTSNNIERLLLDGGGAWYTMEPYMCEPIVKYNVRFNDVVWNARLSGSAKSQPRHCSCLQHVLKKP